MSIEPDTLPAELRGKFAAIRRWQAFSRLVTVVAVFAVAGMFYQFATSTRTQVEANFADTERNQKVINDALPLVTPVVTESLTKLMTDVAPVYQQLAAERYAKVRDSLGATAVIRFKSLPEQGGKLMATKLSASFDRVLAKIEPELKATFPSLTDAQRRDLLVDYFARTIEEKNKEIALKVDAVRVNELSRVNAVLEKFQLPPDEMAPGTDQLKKDLVRTMILLAEQELLQLDRPQVADVDPAIKASATTSPK